MLKDKRHVFWQALFVQVLIFALGLVMGTYIEQIRSDNSNFLFYQSESNFYDTLAMIDLLDSQDFSCNNKIDAHILFADKIYEEARSLEDYDESNKITKSVKALHTKYDLLRTILWSHSLKLQKECPAFNTVVYFYIYDTEDIKIKAEQTTLSKVLSDVKNKYGSSVMLIPISVDNDVASLDLLLDYYGIGEFPSIFINEEVLITDLVDVEEVEKNLKFSSFE